jgi:hypothetical protein
MVIDMMEDYYGLIAMSKDQIIAEKCFQVRAPGESTYCCPYLINEK